MTYAGDRAIYDADGHIMELPTHLRDFADADIRDQIPLTSYSASSVTEEEVAVLVGQGGKHSDEHLNHLRSLGDGLIAQSKDCLLYTSPSPRDRTRSRMPSSA